MEEARTVVAHIRAEAGMAEVVTAAVAGTRSSVAADTLVVVGTPASRAVGGLMAVFKVAASTVVAEVGVAEG